MHNVQMRFIHSPNQTIFVRDQNVNQKQEQQINFQDRFHIYARG